MEKMINNEAQDAVLVEDDERLAEQVHHEHHHHSGHHHSGHHHHGHHRKSHRKRAPLKTKALWTVTILLLVLLSVFVVVFEIAQSHKLKENYQNAQQLQSDVLQVELINQNGVLIKEEVKKYLLTDLLNAYNADVLLSDFFNDASRWDMQVPVALKLSTRDGTAQSYKIELADNEALTDAKVFFVDAAAAIYEFEHLYADTTYFYRVTAYTGKGAHIQTGNFRTADTPRILSIDGLSNVRDIGNWKTDSGKRIKQGLLIRGTEMDGAVESGYHLTNEGMQDMLEVYGVKTDMDLRAQTPTSMDALGSRVEHRYYDMVMYTDIFSETGKEKMRAVFSDLANPDNYPVYLHCTYGMDRTGTVCYILEAVLGVSRGDCLKDYGLSNLYVANIQAVEDGLRAYPGATLKAQAEAYLLSCGVTEYQIASIREIFLGE